MRLPHFEPRQRPLYMRDYEDQAKGDLAFPLQVILYGGGLVALLAWLAWGLLRALLNVA